MMDIPNEESNTGYRQLAHLPIELHIQILTWLSWEDHMVVAGVCRAWRQIILNTPMIRSSRYIRPEDITHTNLPTNATRIFAKHILLKDLPNELPALHRLLCSEILTLKIHPKRKEMRTTLHKVPYRPQIAKGPLRSLLDEPVLHRPPGTNELKFRGTLVVSTTVITLNEMGRREFDWAEVFDVTLTIRELLIQIRDLVVRLTKKSPRPCCVSFVPNLRKGKLDINIVVDIDGSGDDEEEEDLEKVGRFAKGWKYLKERFGRGRWRN